MAKKKKDTVPDNINPMNFPHYIFFSSLKDDVFDTYNNAYNYFSRLTDIIMTGGTTEESTPFEDENASIVSLIKQLEQVASIERENEIAFLKAQKDVIEKNIKNGDEDLQEDMQGVLDLMNDNKRWNYKKIITLFNKMRINQSVYNQNLLNFYNFLVQQKDKMKVSLDEQITYTKEVKENDIKVEKQVTDTLRHMYLTNYGDYAKEINKYYEDEFHGLPERINKLYQSTLNLILRDKQFLQGILIPELKKRSINTAAAVQDLIAKKILQYPGMKAKEIKQQIINNFTTDIDNIDLNKFQLLKVSPKDMRSLEEIALTNGGSLANFVLNLSQEKQIEILTELNIQLPVKKNGKKISNYQEYLDAVSKKTKESQTLKAGLSKQIKKAIFDKIKANVSTVNDETLAQIPNLIKIQYTDALKQILQDYTAQGFFLTEKDIASTLRTVQIGPKNFAEIISSPEFTSVLKKNFNSLLEGQTIQLKNDIVFTFSSTQLNLKTKKNSTKTLTQLLQTVIENFMETFMGLYNSGSSGETDVEAANVAWKKSMALLTTVYDTLLKDVKKNKKQQKQIQDFLSNTFFGGISVKEYNNYQNELGYHGGSLGSEGAPEKVLNNIYKMYELGGLTPIETELMMQAVLNCAHQTIAREVGIVDVVQDYLIGGAAMMMFDEGFSTLPTLHEWIENLFGGFAPKQVHLYQFNTLYIPASYVLQNICNNLKKIYNDLIKEETTTMKTYNTSTQVYIENPITPSSVDTTKKVEDRWESVSELAKAQTKIHIMLMAGILDIFQQIPDLISYNVR